MARPENAAAFLATTTPCACITGRRAAMADPGICYCGNYGGGKHTKSARCPDSMEELRARIAQLEAENTAIQPLREQLSRQDKQIGRLQAENKRLRTVAQCNCGCTSTDYSDHGLSCPFYLKGKAERLTAENAELSNHLEEATQSGIDTAREITETLSKRLDEVEAENAGLREAKKSLDAAFDYWQARFSALSDAWRS